MKSENEDQKAKNLEKYKTRKGKTFNHTLILKALELLAQGDSQLNGIGKNFELESSTLKFWQIKFKEEYSLYKLLATMKEKKILNKQELVEENQRLQQALEQAMLKNRALETLIDVAEEELNITVRKKSGPKQSKG